MAGIRTIIAATVLAFAGTTGGAQDAQTLADIRQELSALYVEVQRLNRELSTTGGLVEGQPNVSALERLSAIEAELQRLTGKTENLEFRIDRVVRDGTNRIGDLEFRLCELEDGCDIAQLGDTPSLGGVDAEPAGPAATPAPEIDMSNVAIGEQGDFERAQEALASGDFRSASDQFASFTETYPGGSLSAEAHFLRGTALEALGEDADAARSYLASFSGSPEGERAPDALAKLGVMLAALGQRGEACTTLGEVPVRFPGSAAATTAASEMARLGC